MSLDAVGIVSGKMEESVRFYGLLGVTFQEFGGGEHLEGSSPSGVRIMLDSEAMAKKLNHRWSPASGSQVVLCFKQDTPEKVDSVHQKLVESGFECIKEPWDAFWGQRYCSIRDPNGVQIDLFSDGV